MCSSGAVDGTLRRAMDAAAAAAGDVPAVPQHGDLWERNLLLANGRMWAIDFEAYGDVLVPLYDALHLMFTTGWSRAGASASGLDRLRGPDAEAHGCRTLLNDRAAADGLAPEHLDGILLFYLARMAAELRARHGDDRYSRPYEVELQHAAQSFARGERGLLAAT